MILTFMTVAVMRTITLLSLLIISSLCCAEEKTVYICHRSFDTVLFQATPCLSGQRQDSIKILKRTPEQIEEAERELNKVSAERRGLDKIEQAQRQAAANKWRAEAPQREIVAAKQAAEAARNEAAAARLDAEKARQAATYNPYPVIIYDDYGNRNRQNNYNHHDGNSNINHDGNSNNTQPPSTGVSPFYSQHPPSSPPKWGLAPRQ